MTTDHRQARREQTEQVERIRADTVVERIEDAARHRAPFPSGSGIARQVAWVLTWQPQRPRGRLLVFLATGVISAVIGALVPVVHYLILQ